MAFYNAAPNQLPQMMGNPRGIQPQQNIPQNYNFPYYNNNNSFQNYSNNNQNNFLNTQQQQQNNQYQFLKGCPVSSKEEARAARIDLDGSVWVFTDFGNNKIYTKQISNDGIAVFKTFELVNDETPCTSTEYVTKEEFNKVIQTILGTLGLQKNNQSSAATTASSKDTVKIPETF